MKILKIIHQCGIGPSTVKKNDRILTEDIYLDVPFFVQGKRSANCGPCALKIIFEYYKIKNDKEQEYSVHSINRLLKTSREFGCDEEQILKLAKRVGFNYKIIGPHQIQDALLRQNPILALFRDELHDGHYAVIVGYRNGNNGSELLFHDPWPSFGENFIRKFDTFKEQLLPFDNWLVEFSI